MAFDLETYYEIDQYLKGDLLGEELQMFNQKLNSDPEFAQLVKTQQVANQMVITKGLADLKERMAKDLENESSGLKWTTWLTVIIGIASISTGVWFWVQEPPKKLLSEVPSSISKGIISNNSGDKSIVPIESSKEIVANQSNVTSNRGDAPKIALGLGPSNVNQSTSENTIPMSKNETILAEKVIGSVSSTPIIEISKSDKPTVNCDAKNWDFQLLVSPTCKTEKEGAISINDKQNNLYSFDGGLTFERKNYHGQLEAGDYQVLVKDEDGCVKKNEVEVPLKNCIQELNYAFDPNFETWSIPLKDNNVKSELKVFAKNGQLVFSKNYDDNSSTVWDGKSNNGEILSRGLYTFVIHYSDGSYQKGNISITY